MKRFKNILLLLRPKQWVKNIFVFIPLFFDRRLIDPNSLLPGLIAFLSFSLVASSIYCLNDIQDIARDRLHPLKKLRPLASGALSKGIAFAIMSCCVLLSLALALLASPTISLYSLPSIILFYFLLNVAYSIKLKQYAIIDVFIIASGFVLRLFAGGVACHIALTPWIVLMTFLLTLFLAFAKRRDDVVIYEDTGILARKNINRYNLPFINQIITLLSGITIVCYILYTVSHEVIAQFKSPYVYLTAVWVLAAIIKYLQITIVDIKSGSPTKVLLHNRFIQLCVLGWIAHFVILLYL